MIRFIGDVHGKHDAYMSLIKDCEASVQIGDFGFNYDVLRKVDSTKHLIIPGNHDNYDIILSNFAHRHFLPSYGIVNHNGLQFFYVRGAFSIDWYQRLRDEKNGEDRTWWPNEELSLNQLKAALRLYMTVKPDIMVTHDIIKPVSKKLNDGSVLKKFGFHPPTFLTDTQMALNTMWNWKYHKPKLWIFGHYHTSFDEVIKGTRFKGLAELEYFDYEK